MSYPAEPRANTSHIACALVVALTLTAAAPRAEAGILSGTSSLDGLVAMIVAGSVLWGGLAITSVVTGGMGAFGDVRDASSFGTAALVTGGLSTAVPLVWGAIGSFDILRHPLVLSATLVGLTGLVLGGVAVSRENRLSGTASPLRHRVIGPTFSLSF